MFAVVSVLIVIADRITKIWIDSHMALGETRPLFGKLAQLCYIHNSGAAFSMLEGKQTLLIGLTAAVMIGIIVYVSVYKNYNRRRSRQPDLQGASRICNRLH